MCEDILKRAQAFAEMVWDESGLPEEERSSKDVLDLCKACGSLGYKAGYEEASSTPKMISVNDRLPECGDNYIILKDDGVSPYTFAIAWFDRTWDFPNAQEITHWMPLPKKDANE